MTHPLTSKSEAPVRKLAPGRWLPRVRVRLEEIVRAHAHRGRAVVFDFDNTLICRDLGDATLATLAAGDLFTRSEAASLFSPAFGTDGKSLRLEDGPVAYYEALQQASAENGYDPAPFAAAYAWAVQVMAGLTPADVITATERASGGSDGSQSGRRERPFAYPEMVDLVGLLLTSGFRVYVVSATNVWSTRWAVMNVINPALEDRFGGGVKIPEAHVVGISLLMKERGTGRLYNDAYLVKTDPAYRRLDPTSLSRFELTPFLSFPVPTYAGKVGCVRTLLPNEQPLLTAGDSDNDFPLLAEGKHCIWMARLEDVSLQERVAEQACDDEWLVQPVLTGTDPGFVNSSRNLEGRGAPDDARRSIACWQAAGCLIEF